MTATNHALTGAIIGLIIVDPIIAIPVAFVSHFACDALPHFGSGKKDYSWIKSLFFKRMLVIDASLCVLLVITLALLRPQNWFIAIICAFVATTPDFIWIGKYLEANKGRPWKENKFSKFSAAIQWFQRPIGMVVEVAWFIASIVIIKVIIAR
jgi:hypothetical protein